MNANSLANLKPPFQNGNLANPGGKPIAARNKLTTRFLNALCKDFDENGPAAIVECREKDPARYITIIAALCPKEFEIKRPLSDLSDDDIARILGILDSAAGTDGVPPVIDNGTGLPQIDITPEPVPPLSETA